MRKMKKKWKSEEKIKNWHVSWCANLGAFEGEDEQKYQKKDGKSGFGGGWKDEGARDRQKGDDDDEPPALRQ